MSEELKPWWYPVICDENYFNRLRIDYPENANMSDEDLHDYYNHSRKYSVLWDHIGEAYAEYEKIADAYLKLISSTWIRCKDRLPEPSSENKLQSVKVINQDGDSVYYSYGYKRWVWYLSVDHEVENADPVVTRWAYLPPKPEIEI